MGLQLSVLAKNAMEEMRLAHDLNLALEGWAEFRVQPATTQKSYGQILFVDGNVQNLHSVLDGIDRRGRAVFLLVHEASNPGTQATEVLFEGKVDDLLVYPFRALEVVGKIHRYRQILMWDEVTTLNTSFSQLMESLHEDLKLTERLQKAKLPTRFPDFKGFKVQSRYLAGMRSGGDFFDLAESKDGNVLSLVLTDSSSYGLSTAVMSVLMRVVVRLSLDSARSAAETMQKILQELKLTMGEKDHLSLFYGVLTKKDLKLRYVNFGAACAFYSSSLSRDFVPLSAQGGVITQASSGVEVSEGVLDLHPESRLVLVSDGFIDSTQGVEGMLSLLKQGRAKETKDSLNEMVYRVKSKYTDPDDAPAQDCSALVLDVDARVLRLAP
ncbi:SpoIIE family protein phosphatase [Bdellovibrionota bacterium FG-2]